MSSASKLADLKRNEENLRKEAKKIVKQRNIIPNKNRPTHLFMHEKCITQIVCIQQVVDVNTVVKFIT